MWDYWYIYDVNDSSGNEPIFSRGPSRMVDVLSKIGCVRWWDSDKLGIGWSSDVNYCGNSGKGWLRLMDFDLVNWIPVDFSNIKVCLHTLHFRALDPISHSPNNIINRMLVLLTISGCMYSSQNWATYIVCKGIPSAPLNEGNHTTRPGAC